MSACCQDTANLVPTWEADERNLAKKKKETCRVCGRTHYHILAEPGVIE